ncbi:MAG: TMEM43 family protein [Treponema sp.]|nr:TMEM43 family protein [Treponema sp.]
MKFNLGKLPINSIAGSSGGPNVKRVGFLQNLAHSIVGVFVGILLILGASWLLFWNEVRPNAADAAKAATELNAANASNLQNQAVWVRGTLTGTPVELDQFLNEHINREFVVLSRTIERYVWVETENKTKRDTVGGGTETITTYEYNLKWSDTTPNSSQFKDQDAPENPDEKPGYTKFTRTANDLSIAGYNLSGNLSFSSAFTPLELRPAAIADGLFFSGNYIYEEERAMSRPALGDYRISYSYVENNTNGIVLGRLSGDHVIRHDFQSTGAIKTSSSIYRFFNVQTITEVIYTLEDEHRGLTWGLRFFGFFLILVGFTMLFGPLQAIAGILPFIKKITGAIVAGVGLIFALVLSFVIIVVANILNSVIALLVILALVAALIGFGIHRGKKKKAAAEIAA